MKTNHLDHIFPTPAHPHDHLLLSTALLLKRRGIPTQRFCDGHVGSGTHAPWIEVFSVPLPSEDFIGENIAAEQIAKATGVSLAEVKDMRAPHAFLQLMLTLGPNKRHTPEFLAWRNANDELRALLNRMLMHFYTHSQAYPDRIITSLWGKGGQFVLHNGHRDFFDPGPSWASYVTSDVVWEIKTRLAKYRAEFSRFAKFIE